MIKKPIIKNIFKDLTRHRKETKKKVGFTH